MRQLRFMILLLIFFIFGCSYLSSTETISTFLPQTTLSTSAAVTSASISSTETYSTTNIYSTTILTTTLTTNLTILPPIILQTPSTLFVEGAYLCWPAIEFADYYRVLINGIEYSASTNQILVSELAPGMHNIKVKAIGDHVSYLDSGYSLVFNYEVNQTENPVALETPQNIALTGNRLSWDTVNGAISYVVQFNDKQPITVSQASYDIEIGVPGIYDIKIYAKGNGISSQNSEIATYIYEVEANVLATVCDLGIVGNVVSWSEVSNASYYIISVDGEGFQVFDNHYQLNIETPGLYLISVKAIGDQIYFLDSESSDNVEYSIIADPVFIEVDLDRLVLGEDEFRFVSFNVPNLLMLEDPDWHMVDPWEQEDAIVSVQMMGGKVIRTYTLSVIGGIRPAEGGNQLAHIMGIGDYNEDLFVCLDKAIQLAGENGIYLIIPFIDEWDWVGGVKQFSELYGKTKTQFFTNSTVKQGFKDLIYYVLNRTNTFTGVKYKDDPAILAWELGNELRSAPDAWIGEMAAYVKSVDSNHLLMSGRDSVTTYDLNNANIDIVSAHYYTNNGTGSFASRADADRLLSVGRKPFIIGEYGLVSNQEIEAMIIESVANGTSGSLIWSLRFRNVNGGFYYHNDSPTRSYHYPGFGINDDYSETTIVNLIIQYAHLVSGIPEYESEIPDAPYLFAIEDAELTWRGATGSFSYIIERRTVDETQWQVVANSICDAFVNGPFFVDNSVEDGISYEYRVQAVNQAGSSGYSNIVLYTHQS